MTEDKKDYVIFDMQGRKGAYVKYFYYVDGKMYRHEVTRLTHVRNPFEIGDTIDLKEIQTKNPDYKGQRVEQAWHAGRIIYKELYTYELIQELKAATTSDWDIDDDLYGDDL